LLASHLLDPADTADDVKQAALALIALGSASDVPTLKEFFAMYRDAPDDLSEMSDALVSTGQALMKLDGKAGRAVVDLALAHPFTNSTAKVKLQAVVEAADAEQAPKGQPAPATSATRPAKGH
jgi:hypothetical protein